MNEESETRRGSEGSAQRPEALLKSALEKIVYFEAHSTQLINDLEQSRSEVQRLRGELGAAGQREIELRRVIAELEVRTARASSEREESARVAEALRGERAELIGKMLEASRISGAGRDLPLDSFDLASFIAELRSEVLLRREGAARPPAKETAAASPPEAPTSSREAQELTAVAVSLRAQGRLDVDAADVARLGGRVSFPGRSEETLFGFSVRELSAADPAARARAADRLKALGHPAAAPALAAALHSEAEPSAVVAELSALAVVAQGEAVPVVRPHLASTSPEVRIAALKALLTLDPSSSGPHLAAAVNDPNPAVRRRASLLALGLAPSKALALGEVAIRDASADVRALAALVLGASGAESARSLLLEAMRDPDARVRRSGGQAMSRLLGRDVTGLVELDHVQRHREVRRLARVPANPVRAASSGPTRPPLIAPQPPAPAVAPARRAPPPPPPAPEPAVRRAPAAATVRVVTVEEAPKTPHVEPVEGSSAPSSTCQAVVRELRASLRGQPVDELARSIGSSPEEALRACATLLEQGTVVRRGLRYFMA